MDYLKKALKFTVNHPILLLVFILINFLTILFQTGRYSSTLLMPWRPKDPFSVIIVFGIAVIGLLLFSGFYSVLWKKFKEPTTKIKNFLSEVKKYMATFLVVSIIWSVSFMILRFIQYFFLKSFLGPNTRSFIHSTELLNVAICQIPRFLVAVGFVYAHACIFVKNIENFQAVSVSWRFLTKNFFRSWPVVYLLCGSLFFRIFLIHFLYKFNDPLINLPFLIIDNLINNTIKFIIFLTSSQIFQDYYDENIYRKYAKPLYK